MIISAESVNALKSKAMLLSALDKAADIFMGDVSEDVLLKFVMTETRGCIDPYRVREEIRTWWRVKVTVE